jgi:hypothetical protein
MKAPWRRRAPRKRSAAVAQLSDLPAADVRLQLVPVRLQVLEAAHDLRAQLRQARVSAFSKRNAAPSATSGAESVRPDRACAHSFVFGVTR